MALRPSDDTHFAEEERRLARDGNPYTFDEFVDYDGEEWATRYWNSADIHRAEESRGGPLQIRANDAVLIYAQLEAQQPQFRDDHTLYVYDRTTFPNPYVPEGSGVPPPAAHALAGAFLTESEAVAARVKPLYGDTNSNDHTPPDDFYEPQSE